MSMSMQCELTSLVTVCNEIDDSKWKKKVSLQNVFFIPGVEGKLVTFAAPVPERFLSYITQRN